MTEDSVIRGRIRDANGRLVVPLDPVKLYLLRRFAVIPRETLRAIALEVDRTWTKMGYGLVAINVILWLACAGGMVSYTLFFSRSRRFDGMLLAIMIVQFAFICGGFLTGWFSAKTKRLPLVRAAFSKFAHCAHCGYDLRGLPAAVGGTTACPECGCAWHVGETNVLNSNDSARLNQKRQIRGRLATLLLLVLLTFGLVLGSFLTARRARTAGVRAVPTSAPASAPSAPPASSRTGP